MGGQVPIKKKMLKGEVKKEVKTLKNIFEKYAAIGVEKDKVIEDYIQLKDEISTQTGLKGNELEIKVLKSLEDKFIQLLEGVDNYEP